MLPTSRSADWPRRPRVPRRPGAEQALEQALAGRAREEQREHAARAALDLEEHAGQVAPSRASAAIGLRRAAARVGHAHLAGAAHEAGERAGGVAGADARELAHAVDVRFCEGCGFAHVELVQVEEEDGRPSPSTVRPASAARRASMRGSGFT